MKNFMEVSFKWLSTNNQESLDVHSLVKITHFKCLVCAGYVPKNKLWSTEWNLLVLSSMKHQSWDADGVHCLPTSVYRTEKFHRPLGLQCHMIYQGVISVHLHLHESLISPVSMVCITWCRVCIKFWHTVGDSHQLTISLYTYDHHSCTLAPTTHSIAISRSYIPTYVRRCVFRPALMLQSMYCSIFAKWFWLESTKKWLHCAIGFHGYWHDMTSCTRPSHFLKVQFRGQRSVSHIPCTECFNILIHIWGL